MAINLNTPLLLSQILPDLADQGIYKRSQLNFNRVLDANMQPRSPGISLLPIESRKVMRLNITLYDNCIDHFDPLRTQLRRNGGVAGL